MNRTVMRTRFLSIALAATLAFVATSAVHAQTSWSGDEICGSSTTTVCTPKDFKNIMSKTLTAVAAIGGAVLVLFIVYRLIVSWWAYTNGDSSAIKKASMQAFQALIGFLIIFSVFGGLLMAALSLFGTQPWAVQLLRLFSFGFIDVAYAEAGLLPNPLGTNSIYDIILSAANLAMRFLIYPALVFMWVISGFKMIYSQGKPDGLAKARSWLLYAFIITVVAFSLQAFLLAFRGTAERVFGGAGTSNVQTNQNGTPTNSADPNQAPANAPTDCTGKPQGTVCRTPGGRAGACAFSSETDGYGCYVNTSVPGASCTKESGAYGRYGTDGVCY
jgi:hypothetical protein